MLEDVLLGTRSENAGLIVTTSLLILPGKINNRIWKGFRKKSCFLRKKPEQICGCSSKS